MRQPLDSGIDNLYSRTDSGKSERSTNNDKPGNEGTPFWQRGHGVENKPKSVSNGHVLRPSSKHVKLFHSNIDISSNNQKKAKKVTISKSVSMQQGLNHMPPIENSYSKTRKSKRGKLQERTMTGSSSLALPKIDPDVAIEGERDSRESSATYGILENGHLNGAFGSDDEIDSQASEEVYLSDDDPEVSRQNLEKAGDYIVNHDWILQENLAKEARRMSVVRKQIRILVPDDDPMEAIQSRLDEVTMMVKPKAEWGNFIDTIEPEQRDRIMKYKEIDHEQIRNNRRKHWTPLNRFQNAVSTVLLLYRACHPRKRYLTDEKADTAPAPIKKLKLNNNNDKRDFTNINTKSSIGFDVQLSLITQPEHRTDSDIKRVTWVLRATKAFKHLFPAQLESQLARLVSYERHDDRRIVAQQGRDPERFYYVMSGKLSKVREYRLLSGVVTRNEGFIEKGKTTDPEEMTNNWPREHHLVTKGSVELLILEKADFLDLQHTCKGPPVEFLQSLDLFKEFPCEEFLQSPDAIELKYYGQDKMIVKDTNRTPWLHVVKTGKVKVVRNQAIIDVQNESMFDNQTTGELGCTRPYSHADAMLGILAKQRKMKTMLGTVSFPEIQERPQLERSVTEYSWNDNGGVPRPLSLVNTTMLHPVASLLQPTTIMNTTVTNHMSPKTHASITRRQNLPESEVEPHKQTRKKNRTPKAPVIVTPRGSGIFTAINNNLENIIEGSETASTTSKATTKDVKKEILFNNSNKEQLDPTSSDSNFHLPPIHKDERKSSSEFVPHGTYLTREKTEFDTVYPGNSNTSKKETIQRKAYLQLDVLKPGDIFGLDGVMEVYRSMYPLKEGYEGLEHMDPQALASEGPGVTLISDGAEIIKISKRFFVSNAQNNTMLKVETMQREYMSADEAKTVMYDKETWNQYKSVLLQRTVHGLHRNQTDKTL